jgi:flagellar biosynthesis protein FlhB
MNRKLAIYKVTRSQEIEMILAAAAGVILLFMFMGMVFRNILSIIIFIGILYLIGTMVQ